MTLKSRSQTQTQRLAAALGQFLRAGDVVGLVGPLGAGKTCFVKGLAGGLGISRAAPVLSPTFALVVEHVGRLRLFHIDLYRLTKEDELETLGLRDYYGADDGVVAIEWIDRFSSAAPPDWLEIRLTLAERSTRHLEVIPHGPRSQELLRQWDSTRRASL